MSLMMAMLLHPALLKERGIVKKQLNGIKY